MQNISRGALAFMTLAALAQPATAQLTPPRQYTISPTNVNLLDATYATSVDDISIGSLTLQRSYLGGQEVSNHYFGAGWTHNYDMWALYNSVGGNALVRVVLGRSKYVFDGTPSSNYPEVDETGTTLTLSGSAYVFTDRDGTVYTFDGASGTQHIATIKSPDGTLITVSYASGKPKLVTSNRGYALVFDYSGGNVSAACGFNLATTYVTTGTTCSGAAVHTSYGYTGSNLTSVTDVIGNTAHYSYRSGTLPGIACLTDPGTTTCKVTNSYRAGGYDINQQTMGDGTTWSYTCSCTSNGRSDPPDPDPTDSTGWTDPSGHGMAFDFENHSMTDYTDQNGKVTYTLYAGRLPFSVTLPEGNKVVWNYNGRNVDSGYTFKAKPGSGLSDIATGTKTFPTSCTNRITCNEPTSVTDGNGNTTTYTYDPVHGGVLTETMPAVGGINPVVRHAYAQQYAYISNGSGGYAAAAAPVWLRTEDRTCRATATVGGACAGGTSDEVVTSYDYGPASGPNNLLMRGKAVTADGITLRTCYGYDAQGNRISATSPRAGLASCS